LPEWWVERGIGETRAVRIEDSEIVEAQVRLEGVIPAGSIIPARLTDIGAGGRNAVATDTHGREYLLPRGANGITEGATVNIRITREKMPGVEPWKRAMAVLTDERAHFPPPPNQSPGNRTLDLPASSDELGSLGWLDLLEEARSGRVDFAGGSLGIFPTPAMTLIDVDGSLPPSELALAGAKAAAKAIGRLDIGGSIGIDFPTVTGKAARQAVGEAIDSILLPPPVERTAVNGFGFLQIVRPRYRASLIELAQDRAAFEARALLRHAAFAGPGGKAIAAHPAVIAVLEAQPDWIEALARQAGGRIALRADPALTMSGGHADNL
jgi:hypothetical protein